MNKLSFLTASLIMALVSLAYLPYKVKAQDLVKGKDLNLDYCLKNFKQCADIAESASILNSMYAKDGESEANWFKRTKSVLTENGPGWDKGYSSVDRIEPSLLNNIVRKFFKLPKIDEQAIIGYKEINLGGDLKSQYLVSIRGTEPKKIEDIRSDLDALQGGGYQGSALGFSRYADAIVTSDEFQRLEQRVYNDIISNKKFEVLITGHSLGGAAAVIVKAKLEENIISRLKQQYRNDPEKAAFYIQKYKDSSQGITFGAPPAGDASFANKYGTRVTAIKVKGDLVPSLPTSSLNGKIVGEQYELDSDFKSVGNRSEEGINASLDQRDDAIRNRDVLKLLSGFFNFVTTPITAPFGAIGQSVKIHTDSYTESERFDAARGELNDWYNLRNDLMTRHLSGITQGGSSHIGSASYYLGRSTQDDRIETDETIAGRIYQNNSPRVQSPQQTSQYIPADSITNLKAPVDIVLGWDQPTRNNLLLDLDSHLTGPTPLGVDSPIRFHTRFDSRGSTSQAPFAELYKDVRPDQGTFGKEQTRIQVLQTNGIYRFYVHDYTNRNSTQSTDLSNSGANVSVHNGLGLTTDQARETVGQRIGSPILAPTNQGGNVWYVLQLDSRTGILRRVNVPFIYESDRAKVPRIGEP